MEKESANIILIVHFIWISVSISAQCCISYRNENLNIEICSANQMIGFFIKSNGWLKWIKYE